MIIEYAVIPTHSAEWRVAVRKLHEENTVDGNKQDAAPLRQLHHFVPVGPSIRQLCTSPISSLELELVLLRQLAELWRPCALADVWVGFPGVWEVGRIDGWGFGGCEWVQAYPPGESGQHGGWYVGVREWSSIGRNGKDVVESGAILGVVWMLYHYRRSLVVRAFGMSSKPIIFWSRSRL